MYNPLKPKTSFLQKIILISFGIVCCVILLEISLRLGGLVFSCLQQYRNYLSSKQEGTYRILCLGESTTANQYPSFLEKVLNQRNIGIKFSVIDKGVVRTNTWSILHKLESNLEAYRPDMVITMTGINDLGLHMPYETIYDSRVINFWKSFRVYKLTRLLWLHIVTRFKELTSDKLSKCTAQPKLFLQRDKLQLVYTENKAIELSLQNNKAYIELGRFYQSQGRLSEAEASFKKAIELNPKNDITYIELGWFYLDQGKDSEAEASFKKAIELNPKNDRTYGALKVLYIEMGNSRLAREYDKKTKELRSSYYLPFIIGNYHKLKASLDKRGIAYVCAQYPMRSLEPLKRIFKNCNQGVIFVDNEKVFKDAVSKEGYKTYFRDMFGGDFGHCTEKGNRLLAENIANVILKECFNK